MQFTRRHCLLATLGGLMFGLAGLQPAKAADLDALAAEAADGPPVVWYLSLIHI